MLLGTSEIISKIDKYATEALGISMYELIKRSGRAVASAAEELSIKGPYTVLAGSGNNGADGYAAAKRLHERGAEVTVVDVFGKGQRSEGGKIHYRECLNAGIGIIDASATDIRPVIEKSAVIIDAIIGTGARLPLSEELSAIASMIADSSAKKLAVDVPLGVDPDSGEVADNAPFFDVTVELSLPKVGVMSYPARAHVGKITVADVFSEDPIPYEELGIEFYALDDPLAASLFRIRSADSNKGSFGRCSLIVGSRAYRGAAVLALASALRSGVGYSELIGEKSLCELLLPVYPEAIYTERESLDLLSEGDVRGIIDKIPSSSVVLVGPGCAVSEGHYTLLSALLGSDGAPLVLDADSINTLAAHGEEGRALLKNAKRCVLLTPHPLELSRLSGIPVGDIQASRLKVAMRLSRELGCVILLKGAATVITDGKRAYVNTSGSTALSKAGSGDALAGLVTGLVASSDKGVTECAALAAYIHGKAADRLSSVYSEYGVTPSDLPLSMAKVIKDISSR